MADGYTVEKIANCLILKPLPGHSGVPMSAIGHATRLLPGRGKGAILDFDMAYIHGAAIVAGRPADLRQLRSAPETLARAEQMMASLPRHLSPEARHWAVWGEQGLSSRTIFTTLTGTGLPGPGHDAAVPHDAADMRRCLLVMEQVPECRGRIAAMAAVSPEWAQLAETWDSVARAFECQVPGWRESLRGVAELPEPLFAWQDGKPVTCGSGTGGPPPGPRTA